MGSEQYGLRTITKSDYDFIYQVKKDAYKQYIEIYYGKWNEKQQKDYFDRFMETYKEGTFIITLDGKSIGFYNGRIEGNKYEICNICIIPEYQNRGIGTSVLKDVLCDHADKLIGIQYFKNNPVGRLYKRLGFKLVGETSFHYQMLKEK